MVQQVFKRHSIPFDTLQYAKRLQEVGFTEQQAEVQVEMIKEQSTIINDLIDKHLATKADLKLVEERLTNRITAMSYKIIISLSGVVMAGVTILGVLIKIF